VSRSEMTPVVLRELGCELETLAVFRSLLDDPVIGGLARFLGSSADAGGRPADYAASVAALYESGAATLADYVRDAVLEDENVYLVRCGASLPIAPALEASVSRELGVLQRLADLTSDDALCTLAEERAARMPRFDAGQVDLASAYRARIADIGTRGYGIYARYHTFDVDRDGRIEPVRFPDPVRLDDLVGYERERGIILDNTRALLKGLPAANILLTGDAGTGKSSTVKAVVNELADQGLRILEVRKEQLHDIPGILEALTMNPLKFIIFIDDLSFSHEDDDFAALKAILEGSVSAKSDNVVIYATSNRRHLVRERFSDRDGDDIHRNDTMQEIISLSDRFGIHVSFSKPDKATYLEIVHKLASEARVEMDEGELDLAAERFATRRGGRSARGARQLVDQLVSAGKAAPADDGRNR
jgi:predicted AAA+ superfamily ATPase